MRVVPSLVWENKSKVCMRVSLPSMGLHNANVHVSSIKSSRRLPLNLPTLEESGPIAESVTPKKALHIH